MDIGQLRLYLRQNQDEIKGSLGKTAFLQMEADTDALEFNQKIWKSAGRTEAGILHARKTGRITEGQAEFYRRHPARWYGREAARISWKAYSKLTRDLPLAVYNRLTMNFTNDLANAGKLALKAARFLASTEYRTEAGRDYICGRIGRWETDGNLTPEEADFYRQKLESEKISAYLPDFGVHLGIFFASKASYLAPALYALHMIDEAAGITIMSGGSIARGLYTTARFIQSSTKGMERPWIALGVSWIHVLGSLAYPLQLSRTGTESDRKLGEFLVYDTFTSIGRKIPIYGGENTTTEHFFNHIPDILFKNRTLTYSQQPEQKTSRTS